MTQKERMLAGLPYKAWMDGLPEERARAQRACWEFNRLPPDARAERTALLRGLFGRTGEHLHIEEPFHCDLGYNIEVGEWFYANYNCVILDVCRVTIGDNVMFAPNVAIYAAGHPVHPAARNSGYEYGQPVAIGNNVWLGGNTVVTPGVGQRGGGCGQRRHPGHPGKCCCGGQPLPRAARHHRSGRGLLF